LQAYDELYAVDGPIEHVYFPLTLMASILIEAGESTEVDVATVGNEGMLGSMIVLNVLRAWGRTLVQVGGMAVKLPVAALLTHLERQPLFRTILAQYQDTFTRHIFQVGACNLLHTMEERCARWLLMTQDRVGQATFALTQQFLAQMLGVRRATVGLALGLLKRAGLITYARGRFEIRDRAGLEAVSCPCYARITAAYQRMHDSVLITSCISI
jgi:CRP-like cAMP-binding protein